MRNAAIILLLVCTVNVQATTSNTTNSTGSSCDSDDLSYSDIENCLEVAAKVSTVAAAIIAFVCACCCICPFLYAIADEGKDVSCFGALSGFCSFALDVFSFIMCWGVYVTVKADDDMADWVVQATLWLSVIPTIFAFIGLLIGGLMLFSGDDDVGEYEALVGLLLMLSPWRAVVGMYFDSAEEQADEDAFTICIAICKYFVIDLPLGVVCICVLVDHGWNLSCGLKAIQQCTTIFVFCAIRIVKFACLGGGDGEGSVVARV